MAQALEPFQAEFACGFAALISFVTLGELLNLSESQPICLLPLQVVGKLKRDSGCKVLGFGQHHSNCSINGALLSPELKPQPLSPLSPLPYIQSSLSGSGTTAIPFPPAPTPTPLEPDHKISKGWEAGDIFSGDIWVKNS